MALEKANGIVLRLSDYSETSQIATFLTDCFGKVAVIAKGSKRSTSSTGGALDLLGLYEILYSPAPAGGLATMREARAADQFDMSRLSPAHYYAALYFAELSDVFGEGSEGSGDHFDLLLAGLKALQAAQREGIANLLAWFESHILEISGLAPNLARCAHCGTPPAAGADARISLADGGILCQACPGGAAVSPAALAALRRLADSTPQGVARLRLSGDVEREVGGVLSSMVAYAAHRVPRLMKYVRPDFQKTWRRLSPAT